LIQITASAPLRGYFRVANQDRFAFDSQVESDQMVARQTLLLGRVRTPEQGAAIAIRLATLPDDGPTGGFFEDAGVVPW
jgi:hypothetical protein